jgi:hypothetical protein
MDDVAAVVLSPERHVLLSKAVCPSPLMESECFVLVVEPAQSPGVLVAVAQQGPAGPAGVSEEDQVYSKRLDVVSDLLMYKGEAAVGSTESAPVWRIRRITFAPEGDVTEQWAGGSAAFDKVWNDRASEVYA